MRPFRCRTCGAPSAQATACGACGGRTFVLSREAIANAPAAALGREQRRGELVPISEAPSLRRRRRTNGSSHGSAPRR